MPERIKTIGFAGSGNLAWHLAHELMSKGYEITGIWSRDHTHAAALAQSCHTKVCYELAELRNGADLIIIAVADKAIGEVAAGIGDYDGILVHTAGSVEMDVLKGVSKEYAILYPLQTFTKGIPVKFEEVPFFTEASTPESLNQIDEVAKLLTSKMYHASSHQRLVLHAAAVFAGNYSNMMYVIGNKILADTGLPAEVLHPLIQETALKAIASDPLKTQTGPARRNDTATLEKHLEALAPFPEYADLYRLLANLIRRNYE
jgi:predicted short-subunit dehydrogenase-like oxidoreductase (DUF2520 family)